MFGVLGKNQFRTNDFNRNQVKLPPLYGSTTKLNTSNDQGKVATPKPANKEGKPKRAVGTSPKELQVFYTGSVDRLIKWHKILTNQSCLYELIATVLSIQDGSVRTQKVMLMRDKKGPILQVFCYDSTHQNLQYIQLGDMLRCVGRMTGHNALHAFSIRKATQPEVDTLDRFCSICDRALSRLI